MRKMTTFLATGVIRSTQLTAADFAALQSDGSLSASRKLSRTTTNLNDAISSDTSVGDSHEEMHKSVAIADDGVKHTTTAAQHSATSSYVGRR